MNVITNVDIEFTPSACDLLRRLSRWDGGDDSRPWAPAADSYRWCQDVWA